MTQKTALSLGMTLGLGVLLAHLLLVAMPSAAAEPETVITIAAARALSPGTTVTVQGTVVVAAGTYNAGMSIQDATGGIYVYPTSFVAASLGDTVIVTGPLALYDCLLQVAPAPAGVDKTGTAPLPDPKPYATGGIAESSEGWLVVVTGTVSGLPGNPFVVNDGSGPAEVYVDSTTGINLAGIANGDILRVAGMSGHHDTVAPCDRGWQVMPRQQSDLHRIDTTPPTVLSTVPQNGQANVNPHRPISAVFNENLDPATVDSSTFLVTRGGTPVAGTVTYDAATRQATFTPGSALTAYQAHTARLTTGVKDLAGNALAADYQWTFTTGARDTTAPSIASRFPGVDATDVPLGADILVTFSEEMNPATIVGANFTLTGPYGAVPWNAVAYDAAARRAGLYPSGMLLPTTRYTATVGAGATDWAGLAVSAGQRTWSFITQVEPQMYAYLGDIHNHTSYSDGSGTPQQAFDSAKNVCGLDFLAITDHSYAIGDGEWADILDRANAATDATFVGLRGFEYTQGAEGHANVYNTVRHATRNDVAGCTFCDYTPNLEKGVTVDGFYPWLAEQGTQAIDGAGTVLQFNHPGWINFNDWTYHPEVEDVAELEEVGNGWGSSYTFSWEEWLRSLDYGWRVGATNNSDNHNYNWGCISPHRTGLVMPALTKADLLDALRARRTFATEDSNYELFFKGNGAWMGSEIPNTGHLAFQVWGGDPDGEATALLQLITTQGQVVAQTQPNAATFDWNVEQDITAGAHHYFVLAVQADGDRIVSSPIWTAAGDDVRLTGLTIQPSLPTIYNSSLLTARVTNRGAITQNLTVAFQVNGLSIGQVPVIAPACPTGPCADGYATLGWQPAGTGPATVVATVAGAPDGDNPDDNQRTLTMDVTANKIPLILIDAGHNNVGVEPQGIPQFVGDMTLHGYNILFNLDQITAADLNIETVKLLVLNAYGPDQLAAAELQAIGDYVAAGGSLWLNGLSDYNKSLEWAHNVADRFNGLVQTIETRTGAQIPIRVNDDEVLDGNDNNGYPWGILWHNFPVRDTTGVGMNVTKIQSWSVNSLTDRDHGALDQADLGANGFLMVVGDLDGGLGTYNMPNRTHNTEAEEPGYPTNDAYLYPVGTVLPAGAGYDIPGPAGRLFFYGDSNDPFNIFAYVAGDGKQNELFNLEVVMWLLGSPLQKMAVAEARSDPELNDTPDNLDRLVWVEGKVTASYGEFFDVLYIQDDTGGITVFAPAGTASGAVESAPRRGDCVRVVGTIDVYGGDTEIQFFETEQVEILAPNCVYSPTLALGGAGLLPLTTAAAAHESNEGWLVVVTGTVVGQSGSDTLWLDDGSGPVRLFLDGYNGTWAGVGVRATVAGLASEDGAGQRIRVRNHGMHAQLPDDVRWLPGLDARVTPAAGAPLGSVVTYTVAARNPLGVDEGMEWSMSLPPAVTFAGWVAQNGAQVAGNTVTWQGSVGAGGEQTVVFTAILGTDPALKGQTIVATAHLSTATTGDGVAWATFKTENLEIYLPLVGKK